MRPSAEEYQALLKLCQSISGSASAQAQNSLIERPHQPRRLTTNLSDDLLPMSPATGAAAQPGLLHRLGLNHLFRFPGTGQAQLHGLYWHKLARVIRAGRLVEALEQELGSAGPAGRPMGSINPAAPFDVWAPAATRRCGDRWGGGQAADRSLRTGSRAESAVMKTAQPLWPALLHLGSCLASGCGRIEARPAACSACLAAGRQDEDQGRRCLGPCSQGALLAVDLRRRSSPVSRAEDATGLNCGSVRSLGMGRIDGQRPAARSGPLGAGSGLNTQSAFLCRQRRVCWMNCGLIDPSGSTAAIERGPTKLPVELFRGATR